jgi:phosphotransferase system enzyme I (PtsI)
VSGLEELRAARAAVDQARATLVERGDRVPDVPIGVMIELPSAALTADVLAHEADFFSIGTNDLIQYTLAIDRADESVAHLYDPWHPAVLELLRRVIQASAQAGRQVSVCGEMAGDGAFTELLLGLGLRSFSMHPSCVAEIKQKVLRADTRHLAGLVAPILGAEQPMLAARALTVKVH